ncbi:MAG: phosphatidylserine decarboxylase, partial [Myxococcaceae bacterium]
VSHIDQLFCVNKRIIGWLGEEAILVAVGATMVGKVKLAFDSELTTNIKNSKSILKNYGSDSKLFQKGEELGYFEFGSTLVLITKSKLEVGAFGSSIRLGERLVHGDLNT